MFSNLDVQGGNNKFEPQPLPSSDTELDDIPQDLSMLSADQDDIQMSNENAEIQMPPAPPSSPSPEKDPMQLSHEDLGATVEWRPELEWIDVGALDASLISIYLEVEEEASCLYRLLGWSSFVFRHISRKLRRWKK